MRTLQELMLRPWIYLLIVLIGIFLKFYRIDYRYFWYDEVSTIMHTSGINGKAFLEKLPVNEVENIQYYHDLLSFKKQDLTIQSQLKGICSMTNLNPLHYAFLVFWQRIVGEEDIHYRYFNVFIFLLTLPFLFYLTKFLFKSNLAGWIAISIFSVSPFFQYYTVEARYNALCTFYIIINQYFFLRALEGKGIKWWTGYLFSGILCLYSSFNLWLIFIAHFIYILIYKREIFIHYFISSFLIFLGYLPWLISIFNNLSEIKIALAWHEWYGINQNVLTLFLAQLYLTAYSFVTFNDFTTQANMFRYHQFDGNYIHLIFNILMIGLLVFSIYYTYKRTEKKVFAYVLLIIVPQFLYFLITDIVRQTGISLIWRYNNLALIGFIFYLIFLFYHRLSLKQNAFAFILIVFLGLGIISNLYMSNKYYMPFFHKELANSTLLNTYENSLLISDFKTVFAGGDAAGSLAFTNACVSDKIDIFRVKPNIQNITTYFDSSKYSNIYVLHASEELINNLKLQLGEKMDSLQIDGFVNEWQILYK